MNIFLRGFAVLSLGFFFFGEKNVRALETIDEKKELSFKPQINFKFYIKSFSAEENAQVYSCIKEKDGPFIFAALQETDLNGEQQESLPKYKENLWRLFRVLNMTPKHEDSVKYALEEATHIMKLCGRKEYSFFLDVLYDVGGFYRMHLMERENFNGLLERFKKLLPSCSALVLSYTPLEREGRGFLCVMNDYVSDNTSEAFFRSNGVFQSMFPEGDPHGFPVFAILLKVFSSVEGKEDLEKKLTNIFQNFSFGQNKTEEKVRIVRSLYPRSPGLEILEQASLLTQGQEENGARLGEILEKLTAVKNRNIILPVLQALSPFVNGLNQKAPLDRRSFEGIVHNSFMVEAVFQKTPKISQHHLDLALRHLMDMGVENGEEACVLLSFIKECLNRQEVYSDFMEQDFLEMKVLFERKKRMQPYSSEDVSESIVKGIEAISLRPREERLNIYESFRSLDLSAYPSISLLVFEALSQKETKDRIKFLKDFGRLKKKFMGNVSEEKLLKPSFSGSSGKRDPKDFLERIEQQFLALLSKAGSSSLGMGREDTL